MKAPIIEVTKDWIGSLEDILEIDDKQKENRKIINKDILKEEAKKSEGWKETEVTASSEALDVTSAGEDPACHLSYRGEQSEESMVCGSDGVTYDNMCSLHQTRCGASPVRLLHPGPCEEDPCLRHCSHALLPVCGSDRADYVNRCHYTTLHYTM